MKIAFIILIIIHALIHLLGFVKAYQLAEVNQLTQNISRTNGILWLIATLLFFATALLLLLNKEEWWIPATAAIILSQYLLFTTWQDAKFGTFPNVVILLVTIAGYGYWSFSGKYKNDVEENLKQTSGQETTLLTDKDLVALPEPVQKYLHYTGVVGKPKVKNFKVEFTGHIRKNEQSGWMPFSSEQYNFIDTPTRLFFMKAEMKHLPVAGYHRYENGDAYMDIRLLSLFPVQYQEGKEMGISETVTFFNDMCFMAPATLIDKRIKWLETDENKVKASFTSNGITITAWLYFNEKGELVNFISNDRYAQMEDGAMKQLIWSTPARNFREINGYKLMGNADAVYQYPEGEMAYGNFEMTNVEYNIKHAGK